MRKKSIAILGSNFQTHKNEKEVIAILGSNFQTHKFLSKSSLRSRVVTEQRCSKQCFFYPGEISPFFNKEIGEKINFECQIQLIFLFLGQISQKF
jgi:hypothetical protein